MGTIIGLIKRCLSVIRPYRASATARDKVVTTREKVEVKTKRITYSPQYNKDGEHDGTYVMKADGCRIGIATKSEDPGGRTIGFTFKPDPGSFLTDCEAPTMKQLKAKIEKQFP